MSAVVYSMQRHRDVTGISGAGPVGTVVEFDDGTTVLHWDTATPSTTVYTDLRHITELHGHSGATTLELYENVRLLAAYALVMPYLLAESQVPQSVAPHPDHPDRLLIVLHSERDWRFWVALLDGSTYAATHAEAAGQIVTTWVTPDGNVWLQFSTLATFMGQLEGERYDTPIGPQPSKYPDNSPYDDRD